MDIEAVARQEIDDPSFGSPVEIFLFLFSDHGKIKASFPNVLTYSNSQKGTVPREKIPNRHSYKNFQPELLFLFLLPVPAGKPRVGKIFGKI
jgi:hypothetical protein